MLLFLSDLRALAAASSSTGFAVASGSLLVLGALYFYLTASASRKTSKQDNPSTPLRPPTTLFLLENLLDLALNGTRFHDWVYEINLKFQGKPWLIKAPGRPDILMVCTPAAFEDIEQTHFEIFSKGEFQREYLYDLLGEGIAAVDGEKWKFQRKTGANLFTQRALRETMSETIQKHAVTLDRILESCVSSQEPIDLFKLLNQFTMESFAEIGFGMQMGSLGKQEPHPFETAFDLAQHTMSVRFQFPQFVWRIMRYLNIGPERTLAECMGLINKTVLDIITTAIERRAQLPAGKNSHNPKEERDVVSLFLDSVSAKDMLNPVMLRDIVINFLIAGRDTSAQTMSWFFYCISEHPEVERKIREEIQAQLPEFWAGKQQFLQMEELQKLTYLEAAIKETLRLYPIVSMNLRFAEQDVVLSDGTFVPQGTFVGLPSYSMGRMTFIWGPDALEYKPERWIDQETGKLISVSNFQFNAFHGGPRRCLGINLAMLEMKTVLVKILTKFHMVLVPGQNVTYGASMSLPIKGGLLVRAEYQKK